MCILLLTECFQSSKKIFHLDLRKIYLLTFTSALKIQYLLAENTEDKYSLKTQVRDSEKKNKKVLLNLFCEMNELLEPVFRFCMLL